MTEQEAIIRLKTMEKDASKNIGGYIRMNGRHKEVEVAIRALEEVEKLRFENRALKNRCYVLTRGVICSHCPIDCSDRTVDFRGREDDR